MLPKISEKDLDLILEKTCGIWDEFRGNRIFITGGTGFFGAWFLESFLWANLRLNLNSAAVVLTRDSTVFLNRLPHLSSSPEVTFHLGDVRSFSFPEGRFSHVIHAAAPASTVENLKQPLLTLTTLCQGTQRVLEFAQQARVKKFLLISSGAIYGKQPPTLSHLTEEYIGSLDSTDIRAAYGLGKKSAELMCLLYAKEFGIEAKIARCFAFIGPYLPLDAGFAIGNFIRDGLSGKPIQITGDGTAYRSYLYSADLSAWLWTLLSRGASGRVYNVGSEKAYSIAELAQIVAEFFNSSIQIAKIPLKGAVAERYVPSTLRARSELGLNAWTDLPSALERTLRFYRS